MQLKLSDLIMKQQVISACVLKFKLFFIAVIVPTIPLVVSFGSQCGTLDHKLLPAENRVLKNFTYRKKTVTHYVICGRDCSSDEFCKSINFHKFNKLCELNNSTRAEHPESFVEDQGSVYFDSNEDTPLFTLPDLPLDRNRSCKTLLDAGYRTSGVYKIYPRGLGLDVYCDMDIDGGGWIVFQRREDGSVDFYRDWSQYKSGFGNLSGEHWLGNGKLESLTSDTTHGTWDLRIDLTDWKDERAFAKYTEFQIIGENYTLNIGEYDISSTAGDSLGYHKGRPFSTKDSDNDLSEKYNCAQLCAGAWWFNSCHSSHLNSHYYPDGKARGYKGIVWHHWHNYDALKMSSMKMRETDM